MADWILYNECKQIIDNFAAIVNLSSKDFRFDLRLTTSGKCKIRATVKLHGSNATFGKFFFVVTKLSELQYFKELMESISFTTRDFFVYGDSALDTTDTTTDTEEPIVWIR